MVESIIAFLASNKAAIGAIVSILEGIVVLINLWRKWKKKEGGAGVMSAPPSVFQSFLWTLNPINCFRKMK